MKKKVVIIVLILVALAAAGTWGFHFVSEVTSVNNGRHDYSSPDLTNEPVLVNGQKVQDFQQLFLVRYSPSEYEYFKEAAKTDGIPFNNITLEGILRGIDRRANRITVECNGENVSLFVNNLTDFYAAKSVAEVSKENQRSFSDLMVGQTIAVIIFDMGDGTFGLSRILIKS